MRHFLCLLMLMTAVSGIPPVYTQTTHYRARAMASYNRRFEMVKISRMSDPKKVLGCDRLILVGTIVSVEYDDQRQIVSFSLKARNGRSHKLHLSPFLYERELPIEAKRALPRLIAERKRVRVAAYKCGASAGDLEADEIKAL